MAEPIKVALTRSDHPSTTWSPHDHADLSLPDGKSIIGTCPTEELRRQLAPFVEKRAHRAALRNNQLLCNRVKAGLPSRWFCCRRSLVAGKARLANAAYRHHPGQPVPVHRPSRSAYW